MAATDDLHSLSPAAHESTGLGAGLGRVWRARGFFGGITAIGLAAWGQHFLVVQNNAPAAGRLYFAAIFVLIASLFRHNLPWRKPTSNVDIPSGPGSHGANIEPAPGTQSPSNNASYTWLVRHPSSSRIAAERLGNTPLAAALVAQIEGPSTHSTPRPLSTGATPGKWAQQAHTPGLKHITLPLRLAALRKRLNWRIASVGITLVLLLTGASALVLWKNVTDPLGGWLWASALVLLVITSIAAPVRQLRASLLPGSHSDFLACGVPDLPRRWELLLIGSIIAVSLALRLTNLEYMPGIFGDEGERGMDARAINEGRPAFLFGYGWWGVPNLYFYLVSFMLRVFGDNMVGDRMLSVISGVTAVWFVYRIGRLLWGPRAGLIAGTMLAVSPLALQFSRLAGESTPTGTLWIVGAFYFFMALRHLRWSDWALSGIFWGFSLYFYAAGKLIIPIIAMLGLYCALRWHRRFFTHYALGFVVLLFGFGLVFMPYAIFSMQEVPAWQGFTGRAQETSIFSPWNQAQAFTRYNIPYDPAKTGRPLVENVLSQPLPWANLVIQQMRVTTEVIYKSADPTPFYQISEHGGSMLSPLWAAIALLGLAYAAWKWFDPRYGLLNIIFWGGMLGAALTLDTPSVQRLAGAWPVLMLFPAVLLDRVFAAAWPLDLRLARRWATVPLAVLLVFFGADSYREYFGHYASLCPYCEATTQARYAQALGQQYKGYQLGVGDYLYSFAYGSTRFVAKRVEGVDLGAPADYFPITDNSGKGAAFIIYPNNIEYLPLIRLFYPDGKEEEVKSQDGVYHFTSYKVTRKQMVASQTSRAIYRPAGASPIARNEPNLGTPPTAGAGWSPPPGITYPASAVWQGALVAPAYNTYTFRMEGAEDARLEIDGRDLPLAAVSGDNAKRQVNVVLARGMHDVRLSGTLTGADSRIALLWAGAGVSTLPALIEAKYLYNGATGNTTGNIAGSMTGGLSAEVGPFASAELMKSEDPFGGQAVTSRRSDPFFGFREATSAFGNAPFLTRWRGTLNVPTTGNYTFYLQSSGPSLLRFDGKVIIDSAVAGNASTMSYSTLSLSAGPHAVEMLYGWAGGPARLELSWATIDGKRRLVPPTALSPAARSWLPSEMPGAPTGVAPKSQQQSTEVMPDTVIGEGAGLANPRGVGVDGDGNIYVGDNGNGRIVVFSKDGKVLRTWGRKGNEQGLQPGDFLDIVDVAVSKEGIVAVSDFKAHRLQLFDRQGKLLGLFDVTALAAFSLNGVAFSPDGNIYIADTIQGSVIAVALTTEQTIKSIEIVPISEAYKLEQPLDVAADASGRVYVVDLKNRIVRVDSGGEVKIYSLPVGTAEGGSRLAVDAGGARVYMSDPDRSRVAALDTEKGIITYFGSPGVGAGKFREPTGITVGPDGRVYVLDTLNSNIQVFDFSK